MVSPTAALVGSFIRKLYSVREGLHGDVSEGVVWVSGEDGGGEPVSCSLDTSTRVSLTVLRGS